MADAHDLFLRAIDSLAKTRRLFQRLVELRAILGNDNHIGDVGEYWVKRYCEMKGLGPELAKTKNADHDVALADGCRVSVKTVTTWSKTGFGTRVEPLDGRPWQILAGVKLGDDLRPEKIAWVRLEELLRQEVFVENIKRREQTGPGKEATKSFPRFQWWDWLDHGYLVDIGGLTA